MKRRRKKTRELVLAPPEEPPAELPSRYGRTRVTLMEVDPLHIYACWEVTPEDEERAVRALPGRPTSWALRFHDQEAGGVFDIPIELASACWYVELWADEKTYVAEIGPLDAKGTFFPVCRSNAARTPRATPAPRYEPRWTNPARGPAEDVRPPVEPEAVAPAKALKRRRGRGAKAPASFGLSSGLWGRPNGA